VPLEAARHRREHRRDHERDALPLEGVDAHDGGGLLVVADRAEIGPDARMDDPPRGEQGGQREREKEVVVGRRARRPEEQRRLESEIAAGDLVLDGDEEAHRLGERPGSQRQVDGAHAQAERAQAIAQDGGGHHPCRDARQDGHVEVEAQERRRVGAYPREGVVGQRELSGVAREEIPAHGKDDVVEARSEDVDVVLGYAQG
jgi:hypothetical protein